MNYFRTQLISESVLMVQMYILNSYIDTFSFFYKLLTLYSFEGDEKIHKYAKSKLIWTLTSWLEKKQMSLENKILRIIWGCCDVSIKYNNTLWCWNKRKTKRSWWRQEHQGQPIFWKHKINSLYSQIVLICDEAGQIQRTY